MPKTTASKGKKSSDAAEDFQDAAGTSPDAQTPEALKAAEAAEAEAKLQEKIKAGQNGSSYLAKEGERHLVHAKLDKPSFSPKDGKKLTKQFIQKFNQNEFKNFERHSTTLGYEVIVLWNPEAYADPKGYAAKLKKEEADKAANAEKA